MARGPTDEEILAHSQAIHDEAIQDIPLISDRLPLSLLAEEYQNGNAVIRAKIAALASNSQAVAGDMNHYFKSRGDGNCFYRAFAFGLLHRLIQQADDDKKNVSSAQLRQELSTAIDSCCQSLESAGISKIVYEDFLEPFQALLSAKDLSEQSLLTAMNDPEQSNSVVVFLRFVTSAYIKNHRELYSLYLMEGEIIDRWCERWVEAMDAEADNIQINALVNALHVGVDVVTLDGTQSAKQEPDTANVLQVRPDEGKTIAKVRVLFRPGHYDVLA